MAERFNVAADVWSVTSYPLLRRGALAVERWNRLDAAVKDLNVDPNKVDPATA